MTRKSKEKQLIIYQTKSGALELRGDLEKETLWATQAEIAQVFDVERSVITKHVGNIFKSGEVSEKSNVQKMHIAKSDKPVWWQVCVSNSRRKSGTSSVLHGKESSLHG